MPWDEIKPRKFPAFEKDLDGKCVKYAFMVRYGSAVRSGASGPKRSTATPPAQDFTVFDRFNPASSSVPPAASFPNNTL